MRLTLRLQAPMVIFASPKYIPLVEKLRPPTLKSLTQIRPIEISQLPLYATKAQMDKIIEEERLNWRESWDAEMMGHPEGFSALYNIVMNSKCYLVSLIAAENPFNTTQMAWIDAGFGHGHIG